MAQGNGAVAIRAAREADIPSMSGLLLADAGRRCADNPDLWGLAGDAEARVRAALMAAMSGEGRGPRHAWLVAEVGDKLVGTVHSLVLPVPPIYAGNLGDPGLLMPECFVTSAAPEGTMQALVEAAEADLVAAGVRLHLASGVGAEQCAMLIQAGYRPITLYLAKSRLRAGSDSEAVRPAGVRAADAGDIAGIVARSAEHRRVIAALNARFWAPHQEADTRFAAWMLRSLTLEDRDMLVAGQADDPDGYAIAQPASHLHFPPAHDIAETGILDDFFHRDFAGPARLSHGGVGAGALLRAAEAVFVRRGIDAAVVICPAAWSSKIETLEAAGYRTAITWMIK
ncbi:hypothetical protein [Stappia sp.]|uniref:hypothetical protein n=1 Tax=Stappia sp. TaxID=1870903 RepID=UPI003A9A1A11